MPNNLNQLPPDLQLSGANTRDQAASTFGRGPAALRWIASVSTSCLHAADAVVRGKTLTDPRLTNIVSGPAIGLHDEIRGSSLPVERYWQQLLAWAHHVENNRELAALAIRKTAGWKPQFESLAARLADRIAALESAVHGAVAGMVDELDLRSRPIRELWEARGPGLMHTVGQLTDERLIVESAEVVLVLPALGGGGAAHLSNNSVRLEAVLTNNVPQLPEVVRLGWLLAQLNCDLPVFSESLSADRLPIISQLALLPPVLQAAQEVELTVFNSQTLAAALSAWHIEAPPDSAAESLLVWWQTYQETRPDWKTALAALEQMVFA